MANTINDSDCLGCGNCEPECGSGAISQDGEVYAIDAEKCDDCADLPCGCRCVAVCPTDAVVKVA